MGLMVSGFGSGDFPDLFTPSVTVQTKSSQKAESSRFPWKQVESLEQVASLTIFFFLTLERVVLALTVLFVPNWRVRHSRTLRI